MLDQLNITKGTPLVGEGGLLKELTKRLLEWALEREMTAQLGYEKDERGSERRGNPRNGSSTKRVKTGSTDVEIELPRDRQGTFEPEIVKKRQGRLDGFKDTVISLYARGMSMRDIRGHLGELYGLHHRLQGSTSPYMVRSGLPLVLVLSFVGCGDAAEQSGPSDASAGGKADGIGEGELCPDAVALNAGAGSAKRCYEVGSGQFVPTACCADLCAGASTREQSNGDRCAWTGEPGLEGASQGQFAPQLCCDLNEDLACGRATSSGGVCADPLTGLPLDDACCADDPAACHPSVASAIYGCVYAQLESDTEEGLPLPTRRALFESCTEEFDLLAGRIDERCEFQPELPFCGLDFETVATEYVAPCALSEQARYDCSLGLTYATTAAQAHITTVDRVEHTLASAQAAGATEQAQITAAAASVYGELLSLNEAFDTAEAGLINVVELYDLSNGGAYTAVEFGAGDTSVGAFFRSGTTERVADVGDGDIMNCEAALGSGGNLCSQNDDCASGFRCEGRIDDANPISTPLGLCIDVNAPASFEACTSLRGCEEGYCAGLVAFDGTGMCSPGWMFGERSNDTLLQADEASVRSDVLLYGQASVPMDLELSIELFHDVDTSNLTVELLIPGYEGSPDDDRPRVTVWPAPGVTTADPTGGRVTLPVRAFGDESINGAWTVVVTDNSLEGASGGAFGWTLAYSSRWD
ncbi:MAG: transposase [Nannocystaceae bacterium]|nr:transposase [Nannocystaceae bacterium]